MSGVGPQQTDLDLASILNFIPVVADVVGPEWLLRKIREAESQRSRPKNLRKYSYLYEPSLHPLVEWSMECERWRKACLKTGRLELSESVIKMASLGRALALAKPQSNFQRLVRRLKDKDQFEAAAFEVEVAASYVARGWSVEFVEEGKERTPDLRVAREDGVFFWVECKRRDVLTERDKRIQSIWRDLESSLLRHLGPRQLNYLVAVKARIDPERKDVEYLRQIILDGIEGRGLSTFDSQTKAATATVDPTGRFEILIQKLSGPDEVIESDRIGFGATEDFDRVVIGAEAMVNEAGKSHFRNPVMIGFKTAIPPDRVSGVVDALRAAVGQLPEGGPAVVWIRIPDNSWGDGLSKAFSRVERLLRDQLTGQSNRRVNAVFVMTRMFERREKDGLQGLGYRPLIIRVDHDNPSAPIG